MQFKRANVKLNVNIKPTNVIVSKIQFDALEILYLHEFGTKYSRMDRVEFVEDSLQKI